MIFVQEEKGKKTMGKFIDMDKLVLPKGTVDKIQKRGVPAILDWLAEQESIEVVRCKDCKFWNIKTVKKSDYCLCTHYCCIKEANGFCDFGERRKTE